MRDLRQYLGETERVMVLAPHPDDECLATGGLLQWAVTTHRAVRVVFITDGDNNPWAQRVVEARWGIQAADRKRWGTRRRQEALASLERLGVGSEAATFLGFPDQGLTHLLFFDQSIVLSRLEEEIANWRPTSIFAPSLDDRHTDHSATGLAIRLLMATPRVMALAPRVFEFRIHPRLTPDRGRCCGLVLDRTERAVKEDAIRCHTSQLRLRGRFLNEFADHPEIFRDGPGAASHRPPSRSVLRFSRWAPDRLSFEIRRTGPLDLLPRKLLLVLFRGSEVITLSVPLSKFGNGHVRLDSTSRAGVSSGLTASGDMRVQIEPRDGQAFRGGFARLEFAWERRVGLFDRSTWLAFDAHSTPASARVTRPKRWSIRSMDPAIITTPGPLAPDLDVLRNTR
jgi:LmbE family N-acetylglucosaminyl deacetylase